ncbi:hypothetical protein ABZO31_17150 [Streptomyces sp. HUAS MG47]|uniref:hypothetical protein n=1 Tax=Streptomyces solicamelliae TaxID=3231716 RepID=UPI003877AEC8
MTNLPDHGRAPELDLPDPPEAAGGHPEGEHGDDPGDHLEGHPTSDLRDGPFRRHAVAAVTATVLGLALGWVASNFRLGSPEFGIPSAAPGSPWPLLAVCGAAGLAGAVLLRLVSARIPVYGPGRVAVFLVFVGTRLALAFRPEAPALAAGCAAGLLAAASWCGIAWWTQRRAAGRRAAEAAD